MIDQKRGGRPEYRPAVDGWLKWSHHYFFMVVEGDRLTTTGQCCHLSAPRVQNKAGERKVGGGSIRFQKAWYRQPLVFLRTHPLKKHKTKKQRLCFPWGTQGGHSAIVRPPPWPVQSCRAATDGTVGDGHPTNDKIEKRRGGGPGGKNQWKKLVWACTPCGQWTLRHANDRLQ